MIKPSENERAELPETTYRYIESLEELVADLGRQRDEDRELMQRMLASEARLRGALKAMLSLSGHTAGTDPAGAVIAQAEAALKEAGDE